MDKQKLAALLSLLTVVVVGAVTYSVYLPNSGAFLEDGGWSQGVTLVDLTDAGVPAPTHALACAVRVSPECQELFSLSRYERVRFGVVMGPLVGGYRDVILPPLGKIRSCVEMIDFKNCIPATCASATAVCAKFGKANPFTRVAADKGCARRNSVRGFSGCRFLDGGVPGEMNVYPSTQLLGLCEEIGLPQTELGVCYIIAGDRAEDL